MIIIIIIIISRMTNCAHNRDFLQLTRIPRTKKFRAYISAKVHKFLNFSTNYLLESLLVLVCSRRSNSGVGAKSENEGNNYKYGGREGEGERKERRSPSLSLPSPTPSMFFLLISFLRRPQSVMCFFVCLDFSEASFIALTSSFLTF